MKMNWGTGIVIGMALFMIFILQYVIRVQMNPEYDNELVTEAYYEKEIAVDANYQKMVNNQKLGPQFEIENTAEGVVIHFPSTFNAQQISGSISLYRPSNQKLDKTLSIALSTHQMLIPKKDLVDGRWDISVDWSYQGVDYLEKKEININ